ncbi:hypothetical protein Glove_64g118 [Diversispora epigaea]|uniref:ZSWIM1/3 RNaseH-like domain-containing protein n=1 Tax=Diversispora epigaea TaxID=1348612 RepID=A0A397JKA3_9GLOM|nr:hypothetical protein Glove_64g118 [Diversispora epigaea]
MKVFGTNNLRKYYVYVGGAITKNSMNKKRTRPFVSKLIAMNVLSSVPTNLLDPPVSSATNVDSPISKEITPSQKCDLLFNINHLLELPVQEFDDNWWSLVSNVWTVFNFKKKTNGDSSQIYTCHLTKCKQSSTRKEGISSNKRRKTKICPSYLCFAKIKVTRFITEGKVHVEHFQNSPNHTYSLEESDKIKRPQIIRNLVEQEALKNYRPPAILNAVKEYAAERMDLDACVKELRRKEVTNIKYKVRGALDAHLIGNPNRELDIQESIFFLKNQKYLVERYMISHKSTHGFVFMHPNQIKNLEKYGWLTLIDSTHKTNRDKIKRPQIIRNLVEQEALKNYRPPAILNAVKEYAAERMDLDACVKELRRKEVTNIKYKVRGALDAHLIGNPNRELDIQESIFFLKNQKYLVERYMISHKSTHGFVFMHPNQIKNLEKYGWLTLIDSTHKTNRYDYRLFTLYIRNEFGCWGVGTHFFVSNEDSDTVAEALKTIRRFAVHWKPRYFLQDQSNVEANGIKMAFLELKNGEQECDTIFCTVHLVRTLMSKIYEVKTRQKMIQAMHKLTRIGCEALIQQAIEECPVPTIKQYIKRYYVKNNHQWALWAHQHSPLLLQVTSTNSLESYHSELKRTTSSQHGLIGACHKVVELDQKKCTDSEYVAFEFCTKKISIVGISDKILNEIHKFPFPVQRMLADEACTVEKRIEKDILEETEAKRAAKNRRLAINELMERTRNMYWRVEEKDILEETEAKRAAKNRRLAINELMERTRNMYWRVEEKGDER